MFHWVNTNQLPLNGIKLQILKLISEVFGGRLYSAGETIWTPDMKAKKLSRVIITGKGIVGAEAAPVTKDTDNEFDVDLSGCILNQFNEPLRAVQDCVVVDLDKKELKKLCMLLRWKFFGVGAANCMK